MKITILSGGSGNSELIKGLKSFYKDADINVVVNAFDSGKSTGVCRRVTNTLGVSDIRKNHIRMYKAITKNIDKRLVDFFEGRYDLGKVTEIYPENINIIESFGIDEYWKPEYDCELFSDYILRFFFFNKNSDEYEYNNFCIGNILYSQMFKELGYDKTNKIICDVLNIPDFVILNTYDNAYLFAELSDGSILYDEGDIVDLSNWDNKIVRTFYSTDDQVQNIVDRAKEAVLNCDLLIISTGTFWSSIYPTLQYGDFYKIVNESNAKKIWAINNEFDGDSYGVTSNDFIDEMENLGLDLNQFTIIENEDARDELRLPNTKYKITYRKMGNNKGKHEKDYFCKAILSAYYNLKLLKSYDKVIFDFDDTLWARDKELYEISRENIRLLNDHLSDKALIISGNNYKSMLPKLRSVYGIDLDGFNIDIWVCAEAAKYVKNEVVEQCDELLIGEYFDDIANDLYDVIEDKDIIHIDYDRCSNIRIKPLNKLERNILYRYITDIILPKYPKLMAYKTGRTTIDIVHKENTKSYIFDLENLKGFKTLYIGDEIDRGNDRDIAAKCTDAVSTSGVEETNILLRLLIEGDRYENWFNNSSR